MGHDHKLVKKYTCPQISLLPLVQYYNYLFLAASSTNPGKLQFLELKLDKHINQILFDLHLLYMISLLHNVILRSDWQLIFRALSTAHSLMS